MKIGIDVVTAIIRRNTGIMHIDRYNSNSSVHEQAIRQIGSIEETIDKITIETDNNTYDVTDKARENGINKIEYLGVMMINKVVVQTNDSTYIVKWDQ